MVNPMSVLKCADIKVKEPSLESLCRLAIATSARVNNNILSYLIGEVLTFVCPCDISEGKKFMSHRGL